MIYVVVLLNWHTIAICTNILKVNVIECFSWIDELSHWVLIHWTLLCIIRTYKCSKNFVSWNLEFIIMQTIFCELQPFGLQKILCVCSCTAITLHVWTAGILWKWRNLLHIYSFAYGTWKFKIGNRFSSCSTSVLEFSDISNWYSCLESPVDCCSASSQFILVHSEAQ